MLYSKLPCARVAMTVGYTIPSTHVPGIIPNGLLQASIQVVLNGIRNVTDERKFFDKWYWSAGMGLLYGGIVGYDLAKAKELNYWWGNEVKYNRTQWSFTNTDKPDYVIDFEIPSVGSKLENDCVSTTITEIEAKRGDLRNYNLPFFASFPAFAMEPDSSYADRRISSCMGRSNFDTGLVEKKILYPSTFS